MVYLFKMCYFESRRKSGIFLIDNIGKGFLFFIYKEFLNVNKKKINMLRGK